MYPGNRIEALNESGGTAAAYTYINRVRARAGQAALAAGLTQVQMRAAIMKERLLELGLEQNRWLDVKRQGMLTPALVADDAEFSFFRANKSEFLPIPQSEIDLNPNVKQNPGW